LARLSDELAIADDKFVCGYLSIAIVVECNKLALPHANARSFGTGNDTVLVGVRVGEDLARSVQVVTSTRRR
jgi:hypothetical protein